ncbi:hypothetical protein PPACK8108_LOCUS14652 [Phakopsora pachyrhizi]|uniref:Uncharacterized protein n=1 Tax=Phakopsora pachyrhizi TaxID=170000 RepID=A0AAV0BA84_PHAPC|nr:hypothetical protein PPACK8108_LOCUS14652 [Phakopsora pachyrhizi]
MSTAILAAIRTNLIGKRVLRILQRKFLRVRRLEEAIQKVWCDINPQILENLIYSMINRIAEVIGAQGWHTHY